MTKAKTVPEPDPTYLDRLYVLRSTLEASLADPNVDTRAMAALAGQYRQTLKDIYEQEAVEAPVVDIVAEIKARRGKA